MSELSDTQPKKAVQKPKKRIPFRLISGLVFILLLAIGIYSGYRSGIGVRLVAQETAIAPQVEQAFQLGVEALENSQYEIAIQQFQFVIEHNPGYPGIQEKYTEALLGLSILATPSVVPSPTVSPTPDLRGEEEIFTSAREKLNAGDWSGAIETLDTLRKLNISYRTVEVDGMYYIALRNRGVSKISNVDCTQVNLEGGMYDLTLASRFGPLDNEATNLYEWSRYYIIGASFWGVDWYQTIYWFGQLMDLGLTSLADSSCMTVMQRFRDAHLELANLYLLSGDWCTANDYMAVYVSYPSVRLEEVQPTASFVYEQCQIFGTVTPTPEVTLEPTTDVTPTPTE